MGQNPSHTLYQRVRGLLPETYWQSCPRQTLRWRSAWLTPTRTWQARRVLPPEARGYSGSRILHQRMLPNKYATDDQDWRAVACRPFRVQPVCTFQVLCTPDAQTGIDVPSRWRFRNFSNGIERKGNSRTIDLPAFAYAPLRYIK